MSKISLSGRIIHQNQLVKELCKENENCITDFLRSEGETYYWIHVFWNSTTKKTVIARKLENGWYLKLAEGESIVDAKARWKARNDPPSLFW